MRLMLWTPIVLAALAVAAQRQDTNVTRTTTNDERPEMEEAGCGRRDPSNHMVELMLEGWGRLGELGVIINRYQFMVSADSVKRMTKHGKSWQRRFRVRTRRREHRVDSRGAYLINTNKPMQYWLFNVLDPFTPWQVGGPNRVCYDTVLAQTFPRDTQSGPSRKHSAGAVIMSASRKGPEARQQVDIVPCECWWSDDYICVRESSFKYKFDPRKQFLPQGSLLIVRKWEKRAFLLGLYTRSWGHKCNGVVGFARIYDLEQSDERAAAAAEVNTTTRQQHCDDE